jgi:glycosyltransferase involved in cell wall biosynthesis
MDGGSTDGSQGIIRKYEPWLAHWTSTHDGGQYYAINQGFKHTNGEIMAWLNSDDMYLPNAFKTVGEVFTDLRHSVRWITGLPTYWDKDGYTFSMQMFPRYASHHIRLGFHDERGLPAIQQESTFWVRQLWLDAGSQLDTEFDFAADYDLWRRFAVRAELYLVDIPLGGFRVHGNQKTALRLADYYAEVDRSLSKNKLLWLNKVLKTYHGQRLLKFYNKFRRCRAAITYNLDTCRWEQVTWEFSR